ncbi:winged helix-turn-helix domain-containing protein [Calidifontibacter terrae]
MTTTPEEREARLGFFLALSSPTRVAIIDALKANGPMTEPELGAWLVAVGDLAPQARPGLRRVHLETLLDAGLVESEVTGTVARFKEGAGLAGGVHWTGVDPQDVELTGAAQEFERVLTERRIHRMRHWARTRWSEWPAEWSAHEIATDNVAHCEPDELDWLDGQLQDLMVAFRKRVEERRALHGRRGERPIFRTFAVFPWGPPPPLDHEAL